MRTKVQTGLHELSPEVKARILRELKKGDQARIAEAVGTHADYVKQVLRYRPDAKSALSHRIWHTANRLLLDRARLTQSIGQ